MNDTSSLSHTTWNCKYHIVLSGKQERNRRDFEKIMRVEASGNYRSGGMPRPYPYVSKHTAENQCVWFCRIFEREEYVDNI